MERYLVIGFCMMLPKIGKIRILVISCTVTRQDMARAGTWQISVLPHSPSFPPGLATMQDVTKMRISPIFDNVIQSQLHDISPWKLRPS